MPTRITELQLVLQSPASPDQYAMIQAGIKEGPKGGVFETVGIEPGLKKLVRLTEGQFAMNEAYSTETDIPVGPGAQEGIKRAVMRLMALHSRPFHEYFYAIARFTTPSGSEFFRTVVPRTAITVPVRDIRHRNKRRRVH